VREVAPNVVLYDRADMGWPATVYNTDGKTPRPKLGTPARWKTVHYTGANVNYEDQGDFVKECQDLERYAVSAGKSNEYNWIVGADGPSKACIATYAGDYVAAHSSGENSTAIGILFMNGVGQRVTDAEVTAFQWLVWDLRNRARVDASTLTTPHKDMPGAATPCPGEEVLRRWDALLAPYSPTPSPLPPEPPPSVDMAQTVRSVLNEGAASGSGGNPAFAGAWAESNHDLCGNVQVMGNRLTSVELKLDQVLAILSRIVPPDV